MFKLTTIVQEAHESRISAARAEQIVRAFLNYCVYTSQKIETIIGDPPSIEKFKDCIKTFDWKAAATLLRENGFEGTDITDFGTRVQASYRRRIFESVAFETLVVTVNEAVVAAHPELRTMEEAEVGVAAAAPAPAPAVAMPIVVEAAAREASSVDTSGDDDVAAVAAAMPADTSPVTMALSDAVSDRATDTDSDRDDSLSVVLSVGTSASEEDLEEDDVVPFADLFELPEEGDVAVFAAAPVPGGEVVPAPAPATATAFSDHAVAPATVLINPLHDELMAASDFYFSLQMAKADLSPDADGKRIGAFYNLLQMNIAMLYLEKDAATQIKYIQELLRCLDSLKEFLDTTTRPLLPIIQMIYEHRRSVAEYAEKPRAFWQLWFQAERVHAKQASASALISDSDAQLITLLTGQVAGLKHHEVERVVDPKIVDLSYRGYWSRVYESKAADAVAITSKVKAFTFARPMGTAPVLDEQLDGLLRSVMPTVATGTGAAATGAGAAAPR